MIRGNTSKNTIEKVVSIANQSHLEKVLDLPCGSGVCTYLLQRKGMEVVSSDLEKIIEVNKSNFIQSDMNKKLEFKDESFDVVVSIDGIEHISRQFDFISECERILRKKGLLVISTPNITSIRSRWRYFLTGFHNKCKGPLDEKFTTPLQHINMISFPELRYMLHTRGLEIKSIDCNRFKLISFLYAPLIPFLFFLTFFSFKKELKSKSEKKLGKQMLAQMFRPSLLFGETTIITAVKPSGLSMS